jgi:hypothetical protein
MSATLADRNRLIKAFGKRLHDDAAQCRPIGYNPSIFLGTVYDHGPVEACRRVIMGGTRWMWKGVTQEKL